MKRIGTPAVKKPVWFGYRQRDDWPDEPWTDARTGFVFAYQDDITMRVEGQYCVDPEKVSALVNRCKAGDIVCVDIEFSHYKPKRQMWSSNTDPEINGDLLMLIIDTVRAVREKAIAEGKPVSIGAFNFPGKGIGALRLFPRRVWQLRSLIRYMDVLFPAVYLWGDPAEIITRLKLPWRPIDWKLECAEIQFAAIADRGKPIVPFVSPYAFGSVRGMPPEDWHRLLMWVWERSDGLVLWVPFGTWNPQAEWIQTLRNVTGIEITAS